MNGQYVISIPFKNKKEKDDTCDLINNIQNKLSLKYKQDVHVMALELLYKKTISNGYLNES